jgi:hypothetical protein
MNDLTLAAVSYLAEGFHLLALTGKRPNPKYHESWDWDNSIHGIPESEQDEAALAAVFADHTTTGVSILIPQHVLVADIDTDAAAELYLDLAGVVPETRTARTPNGLHVWFWAPGADASVWLGDRTLLFKGFGGYVAAPPSRHFDEAGKEDGVYMWLPDARYEPLPVGIEEAIRDTRAMEGLQSAYASVPREKNLVLLMEDNRWTWKGYGITDITGLCRAIIDAPEGNQNNMIAWAAMQARDEGVPYDLAMPQLLAAALEGNHPEHRARATIKGAYKRRARD